MTTDAEIQAAQECIDEMADELNGPDASREDHKIVAALRLLLECADMVLSIRNTVS